MVFLLAPVNREIERIETPPTIMSKILARFSRGNLFVPPIYDPLCLVSRNIGHNQNGISSSSVAVRDGVST